MMEHDVMLNSSPSNFVKTSVNAEIMFDRGLLLIKREIDRIFELLVLSQGILVFCWTWQANHPQVIFGVGIVRTYLTSQAEADIIPSCVGFRTQEDLLDKVYLYV